MDINILREFPWSSYDVVFAILFRSRAWSRVVKVIGI